MGCAASRIDKEERVQICRRRKRLMKHLLGLRGEFADAQLAYFRALKNTGVTLRQFTESESLEIENIPYGLGVPSSPPPPLPPRPPPPPPLSPDSRNDEDNGRDEAFQEETLGNNDEYCKYLFNSSETVEQVDDDNWEETRSDFAEDDRGEEFVSKIHSEKPPPEELLGDNLSALSSSTKDTTDRAMVVWKSKKTLDGIIKALDDYFLKASAGGKEIAVLFNFNNGDTFLPQNFKESMRRRSNSPKVFSVLSWSWSSKSLPFAHDAVGLRGSGEPCGPGAHCVTLEKLYAAELKLYKEVKEEEITKLELERKSMLLQKQEDENNWNKTEKTRSCVENLDHDIRRLQHSISETCSSILKLIEEELYPQLVKLISGLMHMWRTMYECHQAQKQISQRLNHLTDIQIMDFTTDYHLQATAQLQNEVNSWYNIFCKLTKSQRDYVKTVCGWIQLTDCLANDRQSDCSSAAIRRLCEDWKLVFDKLPEEVTAESIRNFLLAIQMIFRQQIEECKLHKKFKRLEKRLQKELDSLEKLEESYAGVEPSSLSPKHPLSLKGAKIEALKKRVETEEARYRESVKVTKDMTLNNLKTSLPIVFEALTAFSRESARAYKAVYSHINEATLSESLETQPTFESQP